MNMKYIGLPILILISMPYLIKNFVSVPLEYFGCETGFDEDKVKKNLDLYRQYAIGSMPCYFYNENIADEWNAIIRKFCNKLPDNSYKLSALQQLKLRFNFCRLLIKDSIQEDD